ncbi:MAG: 3-phosphoshikimate 1-carboxyvinyltransferase [Peptococcaceae bacterium]|nr:3-phosphoshikimate 1-carboxyvinyltransferase [Peptococcaceae bacterium]
MDIVINPAAKLSGQLSVPGDKSISHRAVMLGALAEGVTEIEGFLPGADCLSTVACVRQLGITIDNIGPEHLRVYGQGLHGLQEPEDVLNVGNSGTTLRLLLGILAGQNFVSMLTGDSTIRRRPMARITVPLQQMGATIVGRERGKLAPLAVNGGNLHAINYVSPVASAQVKSGILLAGLYAEGVTSVQEPYVSRDHTERMLRAFGANVVSEANTVSVYPGRMLKGQKVQVPGDISSAAFFLVAGSIIGQGEICVQNVGVNPTRDGIITALRAMGADIRLTNEREVSGEKLADLVVTPAALRGIQIGGELIPRLIDEIPILAVAAALAQGTTEIRDAAELKVKETNRIAAVARELAKFGVNVEELPDGMRIHGGSKLHGAEVDTYGDHRMAMAMSIAALAASGSSLIKAADVADVSFPGFYRCLADLQQN